jgi:uncharacterized integral membrane protein
MNKAKGIFWLIILGFISLLIFQNQDFFLKQESLSINLFLFDEFKTPDLPGAVYFLVFFVSGLLIAYFFSLYTKFKSNQIIKDLNNKIKGHDDTVAKMGEELKVFKAAAEERKLAEEKKAAQAEPAATVHGETDQPADNAVQPVVGEE